MPLITHRFLYPKNSFVTSCLVIADIPSENIAGYKIIPQHSAATAGLVGGRIRHRLRRHAGTVCAITFAESLLPSGLRDSVFVRGQTRRIDTCDRRRKVSVWFSCCRHVKRNFLFFRANKYLQKSSVSRICAIGGFFISIPIFLTGKSLGLNCFCTPSTPNHFRYNSVHLHTISLNAGDRHEHFNRHRDSLLWRRHGAQRVHLAEGEDDGVQLYEAAAAPDDANAPKHDPTPQQFTAPAAVDCSPNAIKLKFIDELADQYNPSAGDDQQQHPRHEPRSNQQSQLCKRRRAGAHQHDTEQHSLVAAESGCHTKLILWPANHAADPEKSAASQRIAQQLNEPRSVEQL